MRIAIAPMREEDIPQVVRIEEQSFPSVWPANAYRRELRENRLARYLIAIDEEWVGPPHPQVEALSQSQVKQVDGWKDTLARVWSRLSGQSKPQSAPYMVGEEERHIVGYAGVWLMVDEAHLTTIAVHPDYRGRGIGELLLVCALDMAMDLNAEVMTLEVRVSNLGAQALYEKYTFERVGLRRGYYVDSREDALVMTTANLNSPQFRQRFQELKRANQERLAKRPET